MEKSEALSNVADHLMIDTVTLPYKKASTFYVTHTDVYSSIK